MTALPIVAARTTHTTTVQGASEDSLTDIALLGGGSYHSMSADMLTPDEIAGHVLTPNGFLIADKPSLVEQRLGREG